MLVLLLELILFLLNSSDKLMSFLYRSRQR